MCFCHEKMRHAGAKPCCMHAYCPILATMPTIRGRAGRAYAGTDRPTPVLLQARVAPKVRAKASAAADAAGMSMAAYLEALIDHIVDESGRPSWLPPRPDPGQQELPLKTV